MHMPNQGDRISQPRYQSFIVRRCFLLPMTKLVIHSDNNGTRDLTLVKIFTRSRRDLAAISARIAARSRRDRGAFLAAEISPSRRDHGRDRGEITARYGKSRRPKTRRDLAAILAEMREISAAKNAPRSRRDSRRDAGNLGGQKRAAISPRFSPRCGKSRRPKTRRDLAEIAARYGNLGRQIRGEMLQRDRGEIRKSRRPKRAVIAR